MAWREATDDELQQIHGGATQDDYTIDAKVGGGQFREATPEELAQINGGIKSGDVEARKKQVFGKATNFVNPTADSQGGLTEGSNKVRPDVGGTRDVLGSILGEYAHGIANSATGLTDTAKAILPGTGTKLSTLLPDVGTDKSVGETLAAVAGSPLVKSGLGFLQA